MKKHTLIFPVLVSAALLSACSSSTRADIRPEVAQSLDEARAIANGGGDRDLVMAKLNQAASVPNLNNDEIQQIRATGEYAFPRTGQRNVPQPNGPISLQ